MFSTPGVLVLVGAVVGPAVGPAVGLAVGPAVGAVVGAVVGPETIRVNAAEIGVATVSV